MCRQQLYAPAQHHMQTHSWPHMMPTHVNSSVISTTQHLILIRLHRPEHSSTALSPEQQKRRQDLEALAAPLTAYTAPLAMQLGFLQAGTAEASEPSSLSKVSQAQSQNATGLTTDGDHQPNGLSEEAATSGAPAGATQVKLGILHAICCLAGASAPGLPPEAAWLACECVLLRLLTIPAEAKMLICLLECPSQQMLLLLLLLLPSCAPTHSRHASIWQGHSPGACYCRRDARKQGAVSAHHQHTASLLTMASAPGCPASRTIVRRGCQVPSVTRLRTGSPFDHSACQTKPQQPDSEPGGPSGGSSPFSSSAHHLRTIFFGSSVFGRGSRRAERLSAASARDEPPTSARG